LLQHPVTTELGETDIQIIETLNAVVKLKKRTIIIGSNLDPGNDIIFKNLIKFADRYDFIKFYPTLPRYDYLGFLKKFNLPKVKVTSKKNKNWKFLCNYKNYISNKRLNINLYYKFSSKIPSEYNWYSLNKNNDFIPSFTKKIFKEISHLY